MKPRNEMKQAVLLLLLQFSSVVASSCGGSSTNGCTATAIVVPSNAQADHSLLAPGNQVQFSTQFTGVPGCAYAQFTTIGSWSTSDPVDISISNQPSSGGLVATCLNATASPAIVSYSGTVYPTLYLNIALTTEKESSSVSYTPTNVHSPRTAHYAVSIFLTAAIEAVLR
jgi:hypothetical protein